ASATDENYEMGLIWANKADDLLDGYSWHKAEKPVIESAPEISRFGPGHNSCTKSEDGKHDVLINHARPEKNEEGDPLDNADRHANAQVFTWNEKGFPVFGKPGSPVDIES